MSLRTALLVLAIVPGIALAALWAVTSGQTLADYQRQADEGRLAQKAGKPANQVYFNLQEERRLSADAIGRPGANHDELVRQRQRTDEAIKNFQALSDVDADDVPTEVREAVAESREAINRLSLQRDLVDRGEGTSQASAYGYYTGLIEVDLRLFAALSHGDNGKVTAVSQPVVDMFWAKEMISRSDALLSRGWPNKTMKAEDLDQLRAAVADQSFMFTTKVVPSLPPRDRSTWFELTSSASWRAKTLVEKSVLRPVGPNRAGLIPIEASQKSWRLALDTLTPELETLMEQRTDTVLKAGEEGVLSLLLKMLLTAAIGLVAVIAVILTTWRLTGNLRRRIRALQERAQELERALPDVVERLALGERIDVEAEAKSIEGSPPGSKDDELTQLGHALNHARTSAMQAAVKQAEQHRGFERLLQRIARRTQRLIGQQLKKLDELERRHDDPAVLDGLYDLDHLTARLRRYEENLVILAGGSPHRRWRKPVPLLDVMRSAQGEVQDYQRVMLDLGSRVRLSERAVGPVVHILAELIENGLSFSKPPTPVDVRAAKVSRGLAIEVEDRGLGMDEEQLADANELMSRPPRMDVLARADDSRLGLFVIARLAGQYGLRVEFRASAFGGTRVVVLVPDELIAAESPAEQVTAPNAANGRVRGQALAEIVAQTHVSDERYPALEAPLPAGAEPLPVPALPYADHADHADHADPAQTPFGVVVDSAEQDANGGPHHLAPDNPYLPALGHETDGPARTAPFDAAPFEATPFGATPFDPAPFAAAPFEAAPFDPAPFDPAPLAPAPFEATPVDAAPFGAQARDASAFDRPAFDRPAHGTLPDEEQPLPRRVRQASLADALRVDPTAPPVTPRPPRWDENPLLRPAPRRAGAAIGAFQRQSRAVRASDEPPAPPTPPFPTREESS